MKKALLFSITAALLSGSGYSQQNAGLNDIFQELSDYNPASAAPAKAEPVPVDKPVQVAEPVPVAAPVQEPVVADPAAVEPLPEKAVVVEALPEEMTAGGFQQEQAGFKSAVESRPESLLSRMYPRMLKESDHRRVETSGMKEVKAAWSTELVFRSYQLGPDAVEKMELASLKGSKDVSALFTQVDFPKGASAVYQPDLKALFVRNTRENLQVLESVLRTLNLTGFSSDTDQVEIEAKFVEVSEGTLEELGFQWDFNNSVPFGGDYQLQDGSGGLFAESLRGSPNNSAAGALPFNKTIGIGNGQVSASGDWSTFRFADTFNSKPSDLTLNYDGSDPLSLVISALDQSSGADVLSAPRIVTRNGEEAVIQVGELHSYPEVFEGNSSQGTMVNISYQDFSDKLLGVELSVSPQVDGDRITMTLNPKITEIVGWQTYLMATNSSIYTYRQQVPGPAFTHEPVVGKLPIFKKREIQCEVTIADGSTIGMGGLISEKKESYVDRVPVLGSLPLIGRFFRNEGERAEKRNLLMFVTAKKVDPSGRVVSTFSTVE